MSKDQVADRLRGQIAIVQKVLRALDGVRHHLRQLPDTSPSNWRGALQKIKLGEWTLDSKLINGDPVMELLLKSSAPDLTAQLQWMRTIAGDLIVEHPDAPLNAVWLRAN